MFFCTGYDLSLICWANNVNPQAFALTPEANIVYNKPT